MNMKKLLFIDTNIWLDFYRARNDASLALLEHVDSIADKVIVTFQLELEFKKNRQTVILETLNELKTIGHIGRPGIFSDAKAAKALQSSLQAADRRVKVLKARLGKALDNPAIHDPVYKVSQRVFHKTDSLVLTREMPIRRIIRRRAYTRYLHGCPPRKKNDTSLGDGFNWEWMLECAKNENAELVIVSRDSDFGITFENKSYVNDHLKHEFSDRVSKKRKIFLYARLSDALKHFRVPVSQQEVEAESQILSVKIDQPNVVSGNSFD
jgi:predicted nucleic acid-binding protein